MWLRKLNRNSCKNDDCFVEASVITVSNKTTGSEAEQNKALTGGQLQKRD